MDTWQDVDPGTVVTRKRDAIAYLTKDGPGLAVPCSRYGRTSAECAPAAWRAAYLIARECGEPVTVRDLDYAMGLAVNDSDDIAYVINSYGRGRI